MKLHKICVSVLLFLCMVVIDPYVRAGIGEEPQWVSIINLISTPGRYHNKKIFVTGWFRIANEDQSLCLSQNAVSTKECIWIELENPLGDPYFDSELLSDKLKILNGFNHQVISIHGVFDMKNTGHFGGWSGGIYNITKLFAKKTQKKE